MTADSQTQRLLDLAQNGDGDARARLIEHACRRLEVLTRRMLRTFPHVQRWEQTGDVLQNALLRLHRALAVAPIESARHFWRLAAQQIRHELLDLARHYQGPQGVATHHHSDRIPADDPGGAIDRHAGEGPADLAGWTAFHDAVEQLPEAEREVVQLLWYQGLTQADAAQTLGADVRTIKRRWASARIQLQRAMHGQSPA